MVNRSPTNLTCVNSLLTKRMYGGIVDLASLPARRLAKGMRTMRLPSLANLQRRFLAGQLLARRNLVDVSRYLAHLSIARLGEISFTRRAPGTLARFPSRDAPLVRTRRAPGTLVCLGVAWGGHHITHLTLERLNEYA